MGFAEVFSKSIGPAMENTLPKIMQALKSPVLPELAARGTAEHPALFEEALAKGRPMAERAKNVPYIGSPELRPSIRATEPPKTTTIPEAIQKGKSLVGAFFQAHPNLSGDVKKILNESGWRGGAARDKADIILKNVYKPLEGPEEDVVRRVALAHDYAVTQDNVAQAYRAGLSHIDDRPLELWEADLAKFEKAVQGDAGIQQVLANRRQMLDGVFADMVTRGWIAPTRHLSDYTPIRKLEAVVEGLANQGGENLSIKLQNAQFRRTNLQGKRETNLILLEHDILADYMKKVVDDETFTKLMDDPTLNFTSKFKHGDILPKDLVAYNPGAGHMGYRIKPADDTVIDSFGRELAARHGYGQVVTPGAYVMPRSLAEALKYYNGSKASHPIERNLQRVGRGLARWLTIYNPANTFLNIQSDLLLATLGLPGEKAQPLGILKAYPKAFVNAMKMSFTDKPVNMKIAGADRDLRDLVAEHGITESTLYHQVQNQRISDELARLIPEADRQKPFVVFDVLHRFRQGAELAPRIAAGVEAFERSGNISEFGRLGRESTLTYGPNGPLASKIPMARIMSPFIQYVGLSTGRIAELLKMPGGRARTIATIMAVPYATYKWNTHNDEFKQVEESLGDSYKDVPHVILADLDNPSQVMRNKAKKPVVVAVRFSVPEDVMRTVGLGNMATRIGRAAEGRDTWKEIATDTGKNAVQNLSRTATVLPGLISGITETETEYGKKVTGLDRVMRLMPITRPVIKGTRAALGQGVEEGLRVGAMETVGLRDINTARKGGKPLDVDLVAAKDAVRKARQAVRKAYMNEGPQSLEAKEARKQLDDAVAELRRIGPVLKEEHRVWRENKK